MDERQHVLDREYRSDISHQDGSLPYRMQLTYQSGGPSYYVNDYFPHFHYQTAAVLADREYDLLIEYWGREENLYLDDLSTESEAVKKLAEDGAADDVDVLGL